MIETITEEQLTPQQAEFWVRARQAVDMNNYPYAVSLLKALVKQLRFSGRPQGVARL